MKKLDITDFKEEGGELMEAIQNAVTSTQSIIIQDYPSEILMTPWQYEQLSWISGNTYDLTEAEERTINTKECMMEIRIEGVGSAETRKIQTNS